MVCFYILILSDILFINVLRLNAVIMLERSKVFVNHYLVLIQPYLILIDLQRRVDGPIS